MIETRQLSEDFHTASQITSQDVTGLKAAGFTHLINHRPDGEEPGQPTSAAIEAEAKTEGLTYAHLPVAGAPNLEQAKATLTAAGGKTLAFCRTGTRSAAAWAMGGAATGAAPEDVLSIAREAGYAFPPAFEMAIRNAAPQQ